MVPPLGRLVLLLLLWGCCSGPVPHTGEIHPTPPIPASPSEEESPYDDEITYNTAKKYNGTWCPAMTPQRSLDIDQLMGIWHVVEIILHRENSKVNKPPRYPPTQIVEGCPTIHLNRNPIHKDILSLLWNEDAGFLEYRFQMTHMEDLGPGYWVSYGPQNGTWWWSGSLALLPRFKHFAGDVIILKAVSMELVLTFCSPTGQFFTVLLRRLLPMTPAHKSSAHALITRRNLDVYRYTQTCSRSAQTRVGVAHALIGCALTMLKLMRRV